MALTKVPGSMSNASIVSKTANYTATIDDDLILCNTNAFTVTLPAASTSGKVLRIKKTDSSFANIITIARAGTDTISDQTTGLTSTTLNTIGETVTLVSNGSGIWQVIARDYPKSWFSDTPTGSWVANTTYTGLWRRVGDTMQYQAKIALGGAPTAAALTINLPATIDTSKLSHVGTVMPLLGSIAGAYDSSATTLYDCSVFYNSTTSVRVLATNAATSYATKNAVSELVPFTFDVSDIVNLSFSVPISGWNG
jgi:hypothetical protein